MNLQDKVLSFIQKDSNKPKIIVIYGPTASGKTSMSIDIAKNNNGEVISTDSRQIYTGLDIGTGKITFDEKRGVKHYMIDIINPDISYSSGEFKKGAEKNIEEIYNSGKIPILCGGTGLYIDSLIYDFKIPEILADEELRKKLELEAEENGKEYIYNKLVEIDPDYAKELHPNNLRYVIRALEVKILSGKSKKDFREEKKLKYDTLFLTPYNGERETLYKNINFRVNEMFDNGLVEEVKGLLKDGYHKDDYGIKSIGYKEVIDYLEGNITLEETIELVAKNNRNYAKKQLTWFRKYSIAEK